MNGIDIKDLIIRNIRKQSIEDTNFSATYLMLQFILDNVKVKFNNFEEFEIFLDTYDFNTENAQVYLNNLPHEISITTIGTMPLIKGAEKLTFDYQEIKKRILRFFKLLSNENILYSLYILDKIEWFLSIPYIHPTTEIVRNGNGTATRTTSI